MLSFEENVHCSQCHAMFCVEYKPDHATAVASQVSLRCPHCSETVKATLKTSAFVFIAKLHGAPSMLHSKTG